jgi:integrase/recombinase XerD
MTQTTTPQTTMATVSADYNDLKKRFLQDMELAGLVPESRRTYLDAVEQLIRFYWCSPELITEQQIEEYLLEKQRCKSPCGSFKVTNFAIRFLFTQTLNKDFHLFKKK